MNGGTRIDGRICRAPIGGSGRAGSRITIIYRGETQALVVATLGTLRDAALIDALEGSYKDTFMLHYNFLRTVWRSGFMVVQSAVKLVTEIARRGVSAAPNSEDFPYTIRVVSEITESNGSSSMASIFGVIGINGRGCPQARQSPVAMGLVKEGNRYAVLTDILGDEDHLGDMDFKVTVTDKGITALQMDIKIEHPLKRLWKRRSARRMRPEFIFSVK